MAFTKKVVAGQTIAAADFAKFFGDHFSEFVKTGFEVTEGTGLVVDISAGTAYVKDASGYMYQIVSGATENTTLADNSTNYVFLHSDNGATYITDSTTATVPDDAILLATVVTASGDVSSVVDNRTTSPLILSHGIYVDGARYVFTATPVAASATTHEWYIYFNPSTARVVTFGTLKFYFTAAATYGRVKVEYNIGAGDVEALAYDSTTGEKTVTLNVSNESYPAFESYVKITARSGTASNSYVGQIRMNYSVY